LQRQHRQCQRQGAGLPAAARARHAELMQALASLATLFAQNVLHDESTGGLSLADAAAMAGLPAWLRDAARQAAAERGLEGALIPWSRSLVMAFLSFSERADLRHAVWRGWTERGSHAGEHDNRAVVADILRCRHELARLTGHTSYADFALEDTMALTPQRVQALLDEVMQRALPKARQEAEALQALRDRHEPALAGQPLHEADWRYWAQRHRREVLALDDAELKPYFELRRMEAAAMDCAARLFGLRFVERADWPTYHADARVFEVSQLGGQPVGALLLDPFSRPGKRSGAWMSSLRWQTRGGLPLAEGETAWATPIILNNNNIARAGDGATLLSAEEVRTLFHEFGHALHGLLSDVPWQQQSGTQVLRDWVELPSQLFEHWIEEPEVLKRHARHHSSGEPMPDALIDKLARARHVGQGFDTVRYCISAQADLALHRRTEAEPPADLLRWEADFIAASGAPPGCGSNHRLLHFQHLFAGSAYASGYYVYLWAEVLEADVWQAFVEAGDVFSKPLAERLRQTIYASGDSIEPNSAFASFRGRAPRIEPLLAQRGLLEPA
jgi:peptidyl-dipeptidase Dcp